jgi:hypothetical protein
MSRLHPKVQRGFVVLFNLYFMRYILDCVNEKGLNIELKTESEFISITIQDDDDYKTIYLDKDGLYQLIGLLHHIQKQIKSI